MRNIIAVPLMIPLLCACAGHITIQKVVPDDPQTGVPWNLPMTQFEIVITRELIKCGLKPEATVDATATARPVVDTTQMYLLNNPGWLSSGKIESELTPRGISSGLTSEVTDETGPMLAALVKAAGTFLTVFSLETRDVTQIGRLTGFLHDEPAQPSPPERLCKKDVEEAVLALHPASGQGGLQDELDTATEVLNAATAKTNRLTMLNGKSSAQKDALLTAMEDMDTAVRTVEAKSKALAAAKRLTSNTVTVVWPTRGDMYHSKTPWEPDSALSKKWFGNPDAWKPVASTLNVWALILRANVNSSRWERVDSHQLEAKNEKDPGHLVDAKDHSMVASDRSPPGLPVRTAGDGMLVVSTQKLDTIPEWPLGQTVKHDGVTLALQQPIFQVGTLYFVPMRGRAFHSESATVKLDEAGNPTSIHVGQSGAGATKAVAAANDILGFVSGIGAARDANELADIKAKTERYNAEVAYADAKAAALLSQSKAQATARTSLAEAKLAQMKAEDAADAANEALLNK